MIGLRTIAWLPLACLALQGCRGPLTDWVWQAPAPGTTRPVETTSVRCVVHELTASPAGSEPAIGVRFSVEPGEAVPAFLQPYTDGELAYVELAPPPWLEGTWLEQPGASLFAAQELELRLSDGSYFRGPRGRVRLSGVLERDDLGTLLRPEQLPERLRAPLGAEALVASPGSRIEERCLDAFYAHDWAELLAPAPRSRFTPTPIAWLDDRLERLPAIQPAKVDAESGQALEPGVPSVSALAHCSLLARLENAWGDELYAVIPVPVLLPGPELELVREGAGVRWSRDEVWYGRLMAAARGRGAGPRWAVRRPTSFEYRFGREIEYEPSVVATVAKAAVTPLTAVLDLLIVTNPYLSNLVRELTGQEPAPERPGGGRR